MGIETVYVIAILMIASQLLFMFFMTKNFAFVLKKSFEKRDSFTPPTLLTVPCKGLDTGFEDNIRSFYDQKYPDYILNFVVESEEDPAFELLGRIKAKYAKDSNAKEVNILVAGVSEQGSQKNHNLLHSISYSGKSAEVFAFADSDARVRPNWLNHLVYPLKSERVGASSGYRWIVPARHNVGTLLLSSMNAKVAQFLGKSVFNQAWGGSMAVIRDVFYSLKIDEMWKTCISDDLSLTYAVKNSGSRLRFSPGCLVATYEETTIAGLFEFARRQFLITRKSAFGIWLIGLFSNIYSVSGIWGALLAGFIYLGTDLTAAVLFFITSAVFIICQLLRVCIRQYVTSRILVRYKHELKKAALFDCLTSAVGTLVMLLFIVSSAFGSHIVWRGNRYKIINATQTRKVS